MSSGVPVNYIHGGNKQSQATPNAFPPVEAGTSAAQRGEKGSQAAGCVRTSALAEPKCRRADF